MWKMHVETTAWVLGHKNLDSTFVQAIIHLCKLTTHTWGVNGSYHMMFIELFFAWFLKYKLFHQHGCQTDSGNFYPISSHQITHNTQALPSYMVLPNCIRTWHKKIMSITQNYFITMATDLNTTSWKNHLKSSLIIIS